MGPESSTTNVPAPISSGVRTWWSYSTYIVFALGIALLFVTAYVIVAAPGLFKVDLPGALLGVAAFLIGLTILDRLPRDVKVGPEDIEFHYFLSDVTLRWDQLAAPTIVGKGFVAFRAVRGSRGVWGLLTVTVDQARAILSHPACPSFELPEVLARELLPSGPGPTEGGRR
jgi:hypothetical protein